MRNSYTLSVRLGIRRFPFKIEVGGRIRFDLTSCDCHLMSGDHPQHNAEGFRYKYVLCRYQKIRGQKGPQEIANRVSHHTKAREDGVEHLAIEVTLSSRIPHTVDASVREVLRRRIWLKI